MLSCNSPFLPLLVLTESIQTSPRQFKQTFNPLAQDGILENTKAKISSVMAFGTNGDRLISKTIYKKMVDLRISPYKYSGVHF